MKNTNQWDSKYDAVQTAPDSHEILFENDKVRVVSVTVRPGEKEPRHHHQYESIMIVDQPTNLRYYDEKEHSFDITKSSDETKVEWMEPEPLHAVENLDNEKTYHAIRVELKQ